MTKGKGGGGNSHQRAVAERADSHPSVLTIPIPAELPAKISLTERVLRFLDNSITCAIIGIMGGLVGMFLDGRYFSVLGAGVSVALYRSKALDRVRRGLIPAIHISAVAISALGLFWVGVQLNKSRPHTYTPADYAAAVKAGTPLPITQQVTNYYRTVQNFGPKDKPPQIQVGSPQRAPNVPTKENETILNSSIGNVGGQTARDMAIATAAEFSPLGDFTGDDIFKRLYTEILDKTAPKSDLLINTSMVVPTTLKSPQQDMVDFRSGAKAIFTELLVTYLDSAGRRYYTESCSIIVPSSLVHTCINHNKTIGPKP